MISATRQPDSSALRSAACSGPLDQTSRGGRTAFVSQRAGEKARAKAKARRALIAGLVAVALLAATLPLAGCSNANSLTSSAQAVITFTSMDTAMSVTVNAANQNAANEAANACRARVQALDEVLTPEGAQSEIARLNGRNGASTSLSNDTLSLVREALAVAQETDGAFDPTVYPLTAAWGFTSGNHRTPDSNELAALLPQVGFEAVAVDEADGTVTLANKAQIDVGGVAKGFAAGELRTLLAERGITSALLDLGGNVTAIGNKPDGSPWKIGVANPQAPDQLVGALTLSEVTVSTSGAYQRFFYDESGTLRHHLIDPATGYPAESDIASVSVIAPHGARCDALSTALYVMGFDQALSFWRTCAAAGGDKAFETVFVLDDGSVHVTAGLAEAFEPLEQFAPVTVVEQATL